MKTFKLCHPSTIRTVLSPDDAKRLQQAGWLQVDDAHVVKKGAQQQRVKRERYRSLGLRLMTVWLPPSAFEAIQRRKRPGESLDTFIARVLCEDEQ